MNSEEWDTLANWRERCKLMLKTTEKNRGLYSNANSLREIPKLSHWRCEKSADGRLKKRVESVEVI